LSSPTVPAQPSGNTDTGPNSAVMAGSDNVERLIREDAFEGPFPPSAEAVEGKGLPVGMVLLVQVAGYFATAKILRNRMVRIPVEADGAALLDSDQDGAGVRAIEGH
jgi:hypothetical protein